MLEFCGGDFYLIDDYYSSPQHKIECTSKAAFAPALVADVQTVLRNYTRTWEVIFALLPVDGKDHAFSVYAGTCVQHLVDP